MIAVLVALLQQAATVDRGTRRGPVNPPAVVTAVRVTATARPMIDGRVEEAAWADAPPITGLVQRDPQEGTPATEPVEVRKRCCGGISPGTPAAQAWSAFTDGAGAPDTIEVLGTTGSNPPPIGWSAPAPTASPSSRSGREHCGPRSSAPGTS